MTATEGNVSEMNRATTMICVLLQELLDRLEADPGVRLTYNDLGRKLHEAVIELSESDLDQRRGT